MIRLKVRARAAALATLVSALATAEPCWSQTPETKPKAEQKQAEEKPARKVDEANRVRKVFQLKHVDPRQLANVLGVFPVEKYANHHLNTLSVSGSPEMVAAVEDVIRRFDVPTPVAPSVPTRNVDLTVHLLLGQEQTSSEGVPAALQPVVAQLTSLFPYKGYRLAETLVVRARDGHPGEVSGVIRVGAGLPQTPYAFSFREAKVREAEKERQIRLDRLELSVEVPLPVVPASKSGQEPVEAVGKSGQEEAQRVIYASSYNYKRVGLKTDIDVREGQKVVVGKATLDGAGQALILVVTAKVID